jgi:hypothetical protein
LLDASNRHRNILKTALVEHVLDHQAQNNHTAQTLSFDFYNATILSQQSNSNKRKLTEASQIWLHQESAVNIKTDHTHLKKCYFSTIKKFCQN